MGVGGRTTYKEASKSRRCPVCDGDHKCSLGADGSIQCGRKTDPQPGFVFLGVSSKDPQFSLYRRADDPELRKNQSNGHGRFSHTTNGKGHASTRDWNALARRLANALTEQRRAELAALLGLPQQALSLLPHIGFSPKGFHTCYTDQPCFTFPQQDAAGAITGIVCRYPDNSKKLMQGSRAGLYLPIGWQDLLVLC
jgi:hypothetical protein